MALTNDEDVEKQPYATSEIITTVDDGAGGGSPLQVTTRPRLKVPAILTRLNARLESLNGFEARGITRVLPSERHPASTMAYAQVFILWFGANISVNNLAVALLGPLVFHLGFLDSALCAVFGALLGSLSTAYMSIWGPVSGNRTMASNQAPALTDVGLLFEC